MGFGPLRKHIIQLAISGQLVEQRVDEPAVEQLGPVPDVTPFELPPKWKWVQLETICSYLQRGKSPKYSEIKQLPVIAQKCNQWDGLHMERALFIDPVTIESYKPERFLQQNDILLNSTGTGTLGRVGLYDPSVNPYEQAVADGHVTVIRINNTIAHPYFIKHALASTKFQTIIIDAATGTTKQKELNLSTVKQLLVPLPPIEEQHRIVAVVDDLMSRLDQMEATYSEFAGPMAEHFRNLMLEKAIRGELVPQLDSEPEVEQVGPAPQPDEVPFELPPKWKWVQLETICSYLQRGKSPKYSEIKQLPVIAQKCNQWDGLHMERALFIDPVTIESYKPERFLQQNDILLNSTGTGTLGRVGLYDPSVNPYEQAVADGHVTVIRINNTIAHPYFIKHALASTKFQTIIIDAATGTTKQKELNLSTVKQLLVPLPPIEEQRRIVAKLEEVFAGVEKLGSLMEYA